MAHDFNNILAIIQGYTSLLLSHPGMATEMNEPLEQIAAATERATNLTRQLMTISRKQILQPQALDLNELIQNIGFLLRRVLGEGIQQQFSFSPRLPAVQADQGLLEKIVTNLALNARDAMPEGGRFSISTSVEEINEEDARRNPEARAGRFVSLTVNDTGKGMDQQTLSRLFEPFFTTKQTGAGLGLATVYGIVKQHQGWVEVSSQPGQGSTFKVLLPALAPSAVVEPIPEVEVRGGSETILVVEDEPVLRELVLRQLRKQGYQLIAASSGAEALAIWPQHAQQIDLLFTDIVMPDEMTGRDLAETLLAQKPDLKVIYTSGYSLDVVEQEFALRKGANFLQKPYHPNTLAKAVRAALDQQKVTA